MSNTTKFNRFRLPVVLALLTATYALPVMGREEVSIIGEIDCVDIHYEDFAPGYGGSYDGQVFVTVRKIVKAPDYVKEKWFLGEGTNLTAVIRFSNSTKPKWLRYNGDLVFSLYPLEHTSDFGVRSVKQLYEQPAG